jgi:DNA-binding CsgD family transcriptional regulator
VELGALVIIKENGEILAMNPAARRLLRPDETARIAELALDGDGPMAEGRLIHWAEGDNRRPRLLWVTPMTNGTPASQYRAVTICDVYPSEEVSAEILVSLFRFTRAEIRLAQQILAGRTPAESAERMSVTIHTVRTYLKRLYLKTGVKTQSAFVRKLLHCTQIGTQFRENPGR